MGRSSSSRKKKHSKSSSQTRAKKKSKIRSQKSKSKKLRRYSTSSSDDYDDDSRSSMSGSYYTSSSEDAKSRRAKNSQVRSKKKRVVVKKRRDRKRSYSTESSNEEDSPRARKRSGSKRKRDYEIKSKSRPKKKLRRDVSFSSYESEDEFEGHREKRGADERDVSDSKKVESPLCGEDGKERVVVEYNPRRLRSIIVKEDSELIRDEEKEEVIFHDDYPSGKSNDSDEKEEQDDKITMLGNEKGDDEDDDDETLALDFGIPNDEKSGNVSDGNEETPGSGDLEMVLRQRALENLRKFRGSSAKPNDKNVDDAKQSSTTPNAEVVVSAEAQLTSGSDESSALVKQNIAGTVNQAMSSGSSKENVAVGVSTTRLKLVRPVFARHLSDISSTLKEEASGDQESQTELQRSKSCLDEPTDTGIATTTIQKSDINGAGANNECVSVAPEPSSLHSASAIDKPRDERSDGSQLEKKTMSIMRGGEMVQVKYQVYIPKKSPALERRKLKR